MAYPIWPKPLTMRCKIVRRKGSKSVFFQLKGPIFASTGFKNPRIIITMMRGSRFIGVQPKADILPTAASMRRAA